MIQLDDLGDARDSSLEVADLLEIAAQLDQWGGAKSIRIHDELSMLQAVEVRLDQHQIGAGLDGQESSTGNVDTVGSLEVTNGSTHGGFQLDDGDVRLALLVGGNGLAVRDDLHLNLATLHETFDGLEVQPDVVGVEVFELLDRLELLRVLLGNLSDFQQANGTFIVDDRTALHVCLGLVRQLHDVLGFTLDHVLKDSQIDHGTQVVDVGEEENLHASVEEFVENTRVVQRFKDISVSGRIPVRDG